MATHTTHLTRKTKWLIYAGIGYLLVILLFRFLVADGWGEKKVHTVPVNFQSTVGEVTDGVPLCQEFIATMDKVDAVAIGAVLIEDERAGTLNVAFQKQEETLWSTDIEISSLTDWAMNTISVTPSIQLERGELYTLRLTVTGGRVTFTYGTTMSAGKYDVPVPLDGKLTLGDTEIPGVLITQLDGACVYQALKWYWPVTIGLGLIAAAIACYAVKRRNSGRLCRLNVLVDLVLRYRYMLKQLVIRDFVVKYKASFLGVLWSFLNPLFTMLVYLFVFSTLFQSSIAHFPVYLICGIVMFSHFSEATALGLNSIIANSTLITKIYIPKYIFPISKVLSATINLLISLIPLIGVSLINGVVLSKALLLFPYVLVCQIMLCTGVALMLATSMVFFRDTQFLWSVVITMLNFLTPVFYPADIIPTQFQTLYQLNPMYQLITFLRTIVLDGVAPEPRAFLFCLLGGLIPLILGFVLFRKYQDKFVLYL